MNNNLKNKIGSYIGPGLISVVVGVVGYFGLDSYMGFNEISKNGISENILIETVEEGEVKNEVTYDYTSLTQKNFNKTHFKLEGRVGKTLEEMENESRSKLEAAYNAKKERTKSKYDEMIETSKEEARKVWGYEDKKKHTSESYNAHINKLNYNYKHIAGEK